MDKEQDEIYAAILRDYFAAAALQGLCGAPVAEYRNQPNVAAKIAYLMADAMMAARNVPR